MSAHEGMIRERLMHMLCLISAETGQHLGELTSIGARVLEEETQERGVIIFKRTAPNSVSLRMTGIDGAEERFSIFDDGSNVRIDQRGRRGRFVPVRPGSPQWNKVIRAYRNWME